MNHRVDMADLGQENRALTKGDALRILEALARGMLLLEARKFSAFGEKVLVRDIEIEDRLLERLRITVLDLWPKLIEYQREAIWVEWAVFLSVYGFAVLIIIRTAVGG